MSQEVPSQRTNDETINDYAFPPRFSQSMLAHLCASRVKSEARQAFEADIAAGTIVLGNLSLTIDLL